MEEPRQRVHRYDVNALKQFHDGEYKAGLHSIAEMEKASTGGVAAQETSAAGGKEYFGTPEYPNCSEIVCTTRH